MRTYSFRFGRVAIATLAMATIGMTMAAPKPAAALVYPIFEIRPHNSSHFPLPPGPGWPGVPNGSSFLAPGYNQPVHVLASLFGAAPYGQGLWYTFDGYGCERAVAVSGPVTLPFGVESAPYLVDPNNISTGLGYRSWKLLYMGDSHFAAGWSPCVSVYIPLITTATRIAVHDANHAVRSNEQSPGSVRSGEAVHVNLSIAAPADAAVPKRTLWSAFLYPNANCSGGSLLAEPDSMYPGGSSGDALVVNTAAKPLSPGPYSYRVEYTGDGWYERFSNRCVGFNVTA
jgi:hypothetical protein